MNRYTSALQSNFAAKAEQVFAWLVDRHEMQPLLWRELEQDCRRYAAALQARGLNSDDQVLIFLRHGRDLYGAYFGTMLGGFVPSFMPCTSPKQDPALYWSSHRELLSTIRPAAVIADQATFAEMAASGLALDCIVCLATDQLGDPVGQFIDRPGSAIGLLQHSSGTTGLKKGVALSFDAIVDQIDSYQAALQLTDADIFASWLPLYHDMGLIACCITPAFLGIPVAQIDAFEWLAHPGLLLETIDRLGATFAWLPNFAFEHQATVCGRHAAKYDLSRLRGLIDCSEPCKPETFDRFASAFAAAGVRPEQLQCCYAMAETVFAVSQTRIGARPLRLAVDPDSLAIGSLPRLVEGGRQLIEVGELLDGLELAVFDEARNKLPAGSVGEIGLRGRFLFSGYNKDAVRTAERLVGDRYFTRDVGFMHDGHLFVLGRMDDLIIINGRNLYAHEVEAAVAGVAGIKRGRAVAVPLFDPRVGSDTLVLIAECDSAAPRAHAEIQHEIATRLLSIFAIQARRIRLVEEGWLVKTSSGKISRKENLAKFKASLPPGASA